MTPLHSLSLLGEARNWWLGPLPPPSPNANPLVLFAPSVAWAALWGQILVLHFYSKGEKLHQDYYSSGKLNAAIAAIETNSLIPALTTMFERALAASPDRRRSPDINALLQSVEFLPDLKKAQDAMASIERLNNHYYGLQARARRLWKCGLSHASLTPLLPTVYVFLIPSYGWFGWLLIALGAGWVATLVYSVAAMYRFHSLLADFNRGLEVRGAPAE